MHLAMLFRLVPHQSPCRVRKHRAPKGALRPSRATSRTLPASPVRKHRAPKGALRPMVGTCTQSHRGCQKAPSAKRCIKTDGHVAMHELCLDVRKHRAPKGALRLLSDDDISVEIVCQKAPSAKRCIKTPPFDILWVRFGSTSESTERQKVH